MVHTVAFATGAVTSTFLGQPTTKSASKCTATKRTVAPVPRMQFDFLKNLPNPFEKKDAPPAAAPPKTAPPKSAEPEAKAPAGAAPAAKKGASLPVAGGVSTPTAAAASADDTPAGDVTFKDTRTRGLRLLAEDLLKNLPEASGVGRQDVGMVMKPQFGEPGYKKQAYETVRVSELGISTFSDDKNYSGNVGGLETIKKAAKDVQAGRSAKEIKAEVLKVKKDTTEVDAFGKPAMSVSVTPAAAVPTPAPAAAVSAPAEKVYPLPDYLMPLPEDTPRKGMTWKNYDGR